MKPQNKLAGGPNLHRQGHQIIEELEDFKPRMLPVVQEPVEMAVRYKDANGKDRVKGGRDLKSSQSYPLGWEP